MRTRFGVQPEVYLKPVMVSILIIMNMSCSTMATI